MNRIEGLYHEAKADKWFKRFAVFCRIALAASFIPTGYIKIVGERFAAGLPSNHSAKTMLQINLSFKFDYSIFIYR